MNYKIISLVLLVLSISLLIALIKLAIKNKNLKEFSQKDHLTGLGNRASFDNTLQREVARSLREKKEDRKLVLIFIDVDDFKKANDLYGGHQKGDLILRRVARFLKLASRQYEPVYRYGGDEFACIVHVDYQAATKVVKRICDFVTKKTVEDDFPITLSVGVVALSQFESFNSSSETEAATDILIHAADAAMYRAKRQGKGQVCVYSPKEDRW